MDRSSHILKMTNSANYQILVQGNLDPRWSGRLGGLAITTSAPDLDVQCPESGAPVTQLSGKMQDQAALFGVLNTLYQLQLPLIAVAAVDDDVYDDVDEQGLE